MNKFKVGDIVKYTFKGFETSPLFNQLAVITRIEDIGVLVNWKNQSAKNFADSRHFTYFGQACFTLYKITDPNIICKKDNSKCEKN